MIKENKMCITVRIIGVLFLSAVFLGAGNLQAPKAKLQTATLRKVTKPFILDFLSESNPKFNGTANVIEVNDVKTSLSGDSVYWISLTLLSKNMSYDVQPKGYYTISNQQIITTDSTQFGNSVLSKCYKKTSPFTVNLAKERFRGFIDLPQWSICFNEKMEVIALASSESTIRELANKLEGLGLKVISGIPPNGN